MTAENLGDSTAHVVLIHGRVDDSGDECWSCKRALVDAASALRASMPCHVTALAVGQAADQEPWLRAVARGGCDRLVCISIEPGEAAEPLEFQDLDHRSIAELFHIALQQLECDVIVCAICPGAGGDGTLAPALAHAMDLAELSDVVDIRAGLKARELVVAQRADGCIHHWRCTLPVVLSVWARPRAADADIAMEAAPPMDIEYLPVSRFDAVAAVLSRRLLGEIRPAPAGPATLVSTPDELLARLIEDRPPR